MKPKGITHPLPSLPPLATWSPAEPPGRALKSQPQVPHPSMSHPSPGVATPASEPSESPQAALEASAGSWPWPLRSLTAGPGQSCWEACSGDMGRQTSHLIYYVFIFVFCRCLLETDLKFLPTCSSPQLLGLLLPSTLCSFGLSLPLPPPSTPRDPPSVPLASKPPDAAVPSPSWGLAPVLGSLTPAMPACHTCLLLHGPHAHHPERQGWVRVPAR